MNRNSSPFDRINEMIDQSGSILISGHKNPDGDSMSSSLAMASFLKSMGKKVVVYSGDMLPFNYMFLENSQEVVCELPAEDPSLCIIVDAGSVDRIDNRLRERMESRNIPRILFDHHVLTENIKHFYNEIFSDESACATAAIIFRWAKERGLEIKKDAAEAIYAGIMSDTGGLRYGSTNRESFEILGQLVDKVSPWKIATEIYEKVPVNQLKLLSEVLSEMKILAGGKAAVIHITSAQLEKYGLTADHVDTYINYARSIAGVKIAIRFRELGDNCWKVSMRSRDGIDSHTVASGFGGGGHKNAAGFIFKGSYEEGLKKVEEIVSSVSK